MTWYGFRYVVRGNEQPTHVAHLSSDGGVTPACGEQKLEPASPQHEPDGYVLACTRCLARSEIT